jgi:hypothetical protein
MAIDTTTQRSRRALLLGAAGGVVAPLRAALGGPSRWPRTPAGNVILGTSNTADHPTSISNTTWDGTALVGHADGSGNEVVGNSDSGIGVYGQSYSSDGVYGFSQVGSAVYGLNNSDTDPAVVGLSARKAAD